MSPLRIVVAGVAGSGKTVVGREVAARAGALFVDGDSLHPAANIEKMSSGIPLDDGDRWPWLASIRQRLRDEESVVVSCSALRRSYRDMLRGAAGVRFLFLDIDVETATDRTGARDGHFFAGAGMVASQFAALEMPESDEADVAVVAADQRTENTVTAAIEALAGIASGTVAVPVLADGGRSRRMTSGELQVHVASLVDTEILGRGARRVLLVPPDHTRLHSRAGEITGLLLERLEAEGCEVAVLPATGLHAAMTVDDVRLMFGDRVPFTRIVPHRWREGLAYVGEITAAEVDVLSGGRYRESMPVEVDPVLLDGWDLVVSIGQVVPHEVTGIANFTKNIVIGLGGAATVQRSHFLGALAGMEQIMGRPANPVRDMIDAAFDRFIAPAVDVLFVLTVIQDTTDGIIPRGLYAGRGGSAYSGGAAFRNAADLAVACNVDVTEELSRVVCWLDPDEFRSTWLGNKAIYRTRMAIADGGELIVLAPGVRRFGESRGIDQLIRRHGYRGTEATLGAMQADPQLAANPGAAAHLIHGSSEGRFRIVYCTDPATGGLTREEVKGAGFEWRDLRREMERLGVDESTANGVGRSSDGEVFQFVANPALGLWATAERLG
jgi:carbohydrate kinase (thermoresistant glucokinase family)